MRQSINTQIWPTFLHENTLRVMRTADDVTMLCSANFSFSLTLPPYTIWRQFRKWILVYNRCTYTLTGICCNLFSIIYIQRIYNYIINTMLFLVMFLRFMFLGSSGCCAFCGSKAGDAEHFDVQLQAQHVDRLMRWHGDMEAMTDLQNEPHPIEQCA